MWSPDRRRLLAGLGGSAVLGACGFTPAYAPGGSGDKLRHHLLPDAPKTELDYLYVAQIEVRLGRADGAPFALSYKIDTRTQGLAITPDQETLRYHLIGRAAWQVTDRATGKVLGSGQAENFTAYSAIGTTVATRASQRDAELRLMVILADQTVAQLIAGGGNWLP